MAKRAYDADNSKDTDFCIIEVGEIDTEDLYPGRWFWWKGNLRIEADQDITNPNSMPQFVLEGRIVQIPWNRDFKNASIKNIEIKSSDPILFAMRIAEYRLANGDTVVRKIKEAIRGMAEY